MRGHVIAVLLLLFGIGAGRADAQTARPAPGSRAGDIREVFLSLPVPAAAQRGPVLARFGDRIATRAQRERELERALGERISFSRLDPRNGYLEVCLHRADRAACEGFVTLTYFTRRNGDRLVAMQARDEHTMRTENYFWRLSSGRFSPVDPGTVLPDLTWTDYWGDLPRPAHLNPRFFREIGGVHLELPQEGTEVLAVLAPLGDLPGPRGQEMARLWDQRRFTSVRLLWDRQRGVFTKGRGVPYDPEEEEHDHDHH